MKKFKINLMGLIIGFLPFFAALFFGCSGGLHNSTPPVDIIKKVLIGDFNCEAYGASNTSGGFYAEEAEPGDTYFYATIEILSEIPEGQTSEVYKATLRSKDKDGLDAQTTFTVTKNDLVWEVPSGERATLSAWIAATWGGLDVKSVTREIQIGGESGVITRDDLGILYITGVTSSDSSAISCSSITSSSYFKAKALKASVSSVTLTIEGYKDATQSKKITAVVTASSNALGRIKCVVTTKAPEN